MNTADRGRRAAAAIAAVAVIPLAALSTSVIHGIIRQRDAATTKANALNQRLRHQPGPVTVTATPATKPSTSPSPSSPPSPTGTASGGVSVVAAGPTPPGGAVPAGGVPAAPLAAPPSHGTPTHAPSSPPSSRPSSPPPRQNTCSTVRVAAETPPLWVLACGTVQTTARIGRPVNGAR